MKQTKLAADGEPPIVSANLYCNGSVSIDLDYLDGQPDSLGDYTSLEEAEKHHKIAFIYPIILEAKNCDGSCKDSPLPCNEFESS